MLMAFSASTESAIVTKAKPLESPLSRSLITSTALTAPACVKRVLSSSSVVDLARFPTYNLVSICTAFSGRTGKKRPPAYNTAGGQGTAQNQLSNYKLLQ